MSSPFVAGGIALWLEADPSLTSEKVLDIIKRTSTVDGDVTAGNPVLWGAGKFNAYEGLKEVIRTSGIVNAPESDSRLMVRSVGDKLYKVFVGNAVSLDVSIYNVAGMKVYGSHADADKTTCDLSGLPAGIYIMNVNGRYSQKIAIK